MSKNKLLFIHSLPFLLGIALTYFFWPYNWVNLAVYITITFLFIAFGKDKNTESFIFIYGVIAGIIVEVFGTYIAKYQSFANPQIFGIPYWLPVTWGYGFVLMKRVALIISKGSPWI